MRNLRPKDKVEIEEKKPLPSTQNTIKLGHFQLATSSFWITIVCILCMFIFLQTIATLHIFLRMTDKMLENEKEVIQLIISADKL